MDSILAQATGVLDKTLPTGWSNLALIFGGVFIFLLLLGWARHHMLEWSIKGARFGVIFGILLTLIVEGLLLFGGRNLIVGALQNEKTPPVVRTLFSQAFGEIAVALKSDPKTLGASEKTSAVSVVGDFNELSKSEQERARDLICKP